MKNEHKIMIFFGAIVLFAFAMFQIFRQINLNESFKQKNSYCELLGQNLTESLQLSESYVQECSCEYNNIISNEMEALCICVCYTDGTVCPNIDPLGNCYFSMFLSENPPGN